MLRKLQTGIVITALLAAQSPLPARGQNAPRYIILSEGDVPRMNDNGGRLSLHIDSTRSVAVGRGDSVMLFRVGEILPSSSFADTGLVPGDEILALNGYQFRDGASYAGYVHSLSGSRPVLDYVEHGTGRIMRIPALYAPPRSYAGRNSPTPPTTPRSDNSDNTGAVVVLGVLGVGVACWLMGCFSGSGGSSAPSSSSSGGSSPSTPTFDYQPLSPPRNDYQEPPRLPSVQGDVHGNLPSDIHGNPY